MTADAAESQGADRADAAFAALYDLIAPELDTWERGVRAAEPALPDADVLDRALRQALAYFRQEAAHQTLVYLKWRAEQTHAAAAATHAASVAAREARAAARAAAGLASPGQAADAPRTFHDGAGCAWSVHEVAAGAVSWAKAPRCLLFGSEMAIRRVWEYPSDWRALSDVELEALSWRV